MRDIKQILFISGSSNLASTPELTSYFWSAAKNQFIDWIEKSSFWFSVRDGLFGPSVVLVSKEELEKLKVMPGKEVDACDEEADNPDLLGVYIAHHPCTHRPAILVSPEKVMGACLKLGGPTPGKGSNQHLPMMRLYPALLAHVAFHELAHAGMCERAAVPCLGHKSWQAIAQAFDAGGQPAAKTMLQSAISFTNGACNSSHRPALTQPTADARHTIEESLANAIALRQQYDEPTAGLLRDWVSRQPPSYRAGLNWQINDKALFTTASSWARSKPLLYEMDLKQNADPQVARRLKDFHDFAARIRDGHARHQAVDFQQMLSNP